MFWSQVLTFHGDGKLLHVEGVFIFNANILNIYIEREREKAILNTISCTAPYKVGTKAFFSLEVDSEIS